MAEATTSPVRAFLMVFARNALVTAAIFVAGVLILGAFGIHVTSFGLGRGGHGGGSHQAGPLPLSATAWGITLMSALNGWLAAYGEFFDFPQRQRVLWLGAVVVTIATNIALLGFGIFEAGRLGDPLLWLGSIGGVFVTSLGALYWFTMWGWRRNDQDEE